ncbi:Ro-like RNA binding protein [Microbacterium phage Pumpernickel]|uniref:Ro-like RNA binding protein n=1 Tax=Microbacterium phage Pumpernickel TaxID=2885983 RepID=A0AAE9C2I3_9CAUD|nr:Ro-like RNA binding protein [Microbacterium phage Pumpernickel]UDL15933.1 Ro-like RNA binding protein [Microbacterium phage Pumpernickel]
MASKALRDFTPKNSATGNTSQLKKAKKGQKRNAAGGFTFTVKGMDRANRFLILGSESNFYSPGSKLTAQNAKTLIKLAEDPASSKELVDLIVKVSTEGRAPKQDPGLFALAIASSHGDADSKRYALSKLGEVARTGSTLFTFVTYVLQFRGWGPALTRAVREWYTDKDVDKAAYQIVKYRSREGYDHKRLFNVSHPKTKGTPFEGLSRFVLYEDSSDAPEIVKGFLLAQAPGADVPALISEYGLTWEMIPTDRLNDVDVWDALLPNTPLGALVRQLPRLTRIGYLAPLSKNTQEIVKRLTDQNEITRSRIHPISVLTALKTYSSGHSVKGSTSWTPDQKIVSALDKAFYLAFKNVEATGNRVLVGLDVSGSMGWGGITGHTNLTPREITAAIAMVIESVEPSTHIIGFTGGVSGSYGRRSGLKTAGAGKYASTVTPLDDVVNSTRSLKDVVSSVSGLPMGGTDIALPMLYAMEQGLEVDTFLILTDNETWAGGTHVYQALNQYRQASGIEAKLVVFSTEATGNTVADPSDPLQLDIAGFDSGAVQVLSEFMRGNI